MIGIRQAARDDALAIAEVEVETWRATYAGIIPHAVLLRMSRKRSAARWRRRLKEPGERRFVRIAEDAEGGVIGFGTCGCADTLELDYEGEIYELYVHPDHQNGGVGRSLLHVLFQTLLSHGRRSALIWVLAENPSRFFYEAMGGRRVAVRNECLFGAGLSETAYGWPNLERALAEADHSVPIERR